MHFFRGMSQANRSESGRAERSREFLTSFTDRREKDLYLEYRRHYDASIRQNGDKNLGDRWADHAFRD